MRWQDAVLQVRSFAALDALTGRRGATKTVEEAQRFEVHTAEVKCMEACADSTNGDIFVLRHWRSSDSYRVNLFISLKFGGGIHYEV